MAFLGSAILAQEGEKTSAWKGLYSTRDKVCRAAVNGAPNKLRAENTKMTRGT